MKKLIILSIIALAFTSCKGNSENKKSIEQETQTIIEKESSKIEIGCYSYNDGKNSINFEITETKNQIIGNLSYEFEGKDSNKGIFKGTISDDILFGIYTFMSEGIESTREEAFIIKDNELFEGYGERDDESGTVFKDKKTLKFLYGMPLKKVNRKK